MSCKQNCQQGRRCRCWELDCKPTPIKYPANKTDPIPGYEPWASIVTAVGCVAGAVLLWAYLDFFNELPYAAIQGVIT